LAQAVLSGELREYAWKALKAIYFWGTTAQDCVAELVRWADRHGTELVAERRRIGPTVADFVRFERSADSN